VYIECFWANVPLSSSTVDLRCTASLLDKTCGTELFYHPRLTLPHVQMTDPDSLDHPAPGTRGLVASCQLDTNRQHVIGKTLVTRVPELARMSSE